MLDRIYDFNKEKSVVLKAFLPFLIVVHHCACMGVPHLGPMMMAGVTICTWFFLISGYGLMASFMAKGDSYLQYFIRKRLIKVIIPFLIAFIVYVAYLFFIDKVNLFHYFTSQMFDHWLPYSWFVFVIIGGYFVFYVIFKLLPPQKGIVCFLLFNLAYIIGMNVLDVPRYWYAGSLGLSIGVLWSWYADNIKNLLRSNTLALSLFLSALFLWVLFSKYIGFKELHPIFTSILMIVIVHKISFNHPQKLICFLSKISFEIYLFQALAIAFVFKLCDVELACAGMYLVMLVDVLVSSFFHFYIINPIINKFSK